jgi:hypothetical protein
MGADKGAGSRGDVNREFEGAVGVASGFGRFQLPTELRIDPPRGSARLRGVPETIEADVLEIDGSPPPAPQVRDAEPQPEPAWKSMRGKVLRLDRRWWPLWVLLGLIAFAFVAVIGVIFGAFLIVAKIIGAILRFVVGGSAPRGGSGLSRTVR